MFEKNIVKTSVNAFTPGVIEPSFGIDRIFAAVLDHVYYARPTEEKDETRGVLAFPGAVSPYRCCILPLDQRVARHDNYNALATTFRSQLSGLSLPYTIDESGATIGRRYARNDELGVPFACTFDFETLEDSTVTLRERDSTWQIRLPVSEVPRLVRKLCSGEVAWESIFPMYPHKKNNSEGFQNPV